MVAQQHSLATEEGFIEEIMGGQKVVQVFNHEEAAKADFAALNQRLFSDSERANRYGNLLGPVVGNMGNLLYVLIAMVGGLLIQLRVTNIGFAGMGAITVGIIVSYLPDDGPPALPDHQPGLPAGRPHRHGPGRRRARLRPK